MKIYKNLKYIDLHEMIMKTNNLRKQKFLDCTYDDTIIFCDSQYKIVSESEKYYYAEFKWNFLNLIYSKCESNIITRIFINIVFLHQLIKLKFMRRWIFSYVSFDISKNQYENILNVNTYWSLYEDSIKFPHDVPEIDSDKYLPIS